jgi:plasmid stabilization system protein ParE
MTRQHLWERYREDHPDGLRNAQGILRMSRDFTAARLQEACRRALGLKTLSYRAVRRLIERVEAPPAPQPNTSPNRWQAQCLLALQSGPHRALMAAARHLSTTGCRIQQIDAHTAQEQPQYATQLVDRLTRRVAQLAHHPHSGRIVLVYRQNELRELIESRQRISYRPFAERIDIITVRDTRRRLPRRLSDLERRGMVHTC